MRDVSLRYDPALDGLRAIAVLAVVLYHSGTPGFSGGSRGVDVFFVLSGYLITSILSAERPSFAQFWQRRLVRLMPALVAMVAFSLAVSPWLIPSSEAFRVPAALFALTYTMNLSEAVGPWNNQFAHTWSLAAEMQFYLIWPFALPIFMRWRAGPAMIALWVALIVSTYALGAFAYYCAYYFPHFGGLALGSAVPFLRPARARLGVLGALLIGLAVVCPSLPGLVAEAAAALLISSLRQPSCIRPLLEWHPLVELGVISYGVYLWHFTIHCMIVSASWQLRLPLELTGGSILGWLSYNVIERPFAAAMRPLLAGGRTGVRRPTADTV
jgi:peptidoglycan/LPS O-acetylase OafA/YrhL